MFPCVELENMKDSNSEAIIDLLSKGWLTHDAMWVTAVYKECGPEIASKLNTRAIQLMTPIEVKRFQKVLRLPKVDTFEKLQKFITGAFSIVSGDFTEIQISYPCHNILHWQAAQCFAYDGIKKMGMIEQYQCGVIERIEGWLKSLNIEYEILPKIEGCNMHNVGACKLDIQFFFDE